jgi:hypothetical protein
MSASEKNRKSLKDALQRMRSYDPPSSSWSRLEGRLDEPLPVEDETPLERALVQLPGHTPPPDVWNKLNSELDKNQTAKRIRLKQRKQWLALAATLALVVSAAVWVFREPPPKVTLQYGEETLQQFSLDIDWNLDEDIFVQLEAYLDQTNDPTVNKLRVEYEELSSAHSDVEKMLRSYGQDPQLVRQMAEIERERTDIYRQIIELI